MRIGFGTDIHRLDVGDGLPIGGVTVPCLLSFVAHSDGDVLLHAIIDALLGALGAGDIGMLYPDTDSANRGRPSTDFLHETLARMWEAGYRLGNLDCVVHAQVPKLTPHKATIRGTLAGHFQVDPSLINIKAKTGEGVGPVGRGEAIAAEAVVLLLPAGGA